MSGTTPKYAAPAPAGMRILPPGGAWSPVHRSADPIRFYKPVPSPRPARPRSPAGPVPPGRDQFPLPDDLKRFGYPVQLRRDDRTAAGKGFQQHQSKRFRPDRRMHQTVDRVHHLGHIMAVGSQKCFSLQSKPLDILLQSHSQRSPSDNEEPRGRQKPMHLGRRFQKFTLSLAPGMVIAADHGKKKMLRPHLPLGTQMQIIAAKTKTLRINGAGDHFYLGDIPV